MIRTIASLIIRIPPLITQQTGFTLHMGLLYVPFRMVCSRSPLNTSLMMLSTLFFGTRMRCMKCENQNSDCQKCIHAGSQQNLLLITCLFCWTFITIQPTKKQQKMGATKKRNHQWVTESVSATKRHALIKAL